MRPCSRQSWPVSLATRSIKPYGALLGLPIAVVRKRRVTGIDVEADDLVRDVEDVTPVLVDDMDQHQGALRFAQPWSRRTSSARGRCR
jgi:phosphoribosylpyrophosphate synthetase